MVGRGREGWESWSGGKGDPAKLTSRSRTPGDFDVVQLSNKAITELLNNEPVKDQADGVRVMRSWSASGRSYQTVDLQFPKMTDFVWPFKMAHPINIQLDKGGWRPGVMWSQAGYDNEWNGLQTYPSARTTGWLMGWGYGAQASNWGGDVSSANSYFRKSGLTVFPYAEVYVRPRISSDSSSFTRIPDEGMSGSTVSGAVSNFAAKTSWGVSGNLNGSVKEGSIQVQALAQVGSTMYVGGNFTGVKQGDKGAEISSRGLAAFDVNTGDFTGQTFDFNAQVKALLALPDGRLLVGGDFTRVNGETHVGTVVINPSTGQIDPSWDLQIVNALRGGAVSVRALTYYDGNVYMGGVFTHLTGGGSSKVYARNAGRVSLSGRPDRSWNPEISGSVQAVGVSEANSAFYAGGHFTTAHGNQRAWYAAKFSTQAGAALDAGFSFEPSAPSAGKYQQTISTAGDRVYIGGSEHSLFGYDAASNQRLSGAMMFSNGGDLQASTVSAKGVIYGSCHCSDATYQDMYTWSMNMSWSRVDEIKWVGAWDAATGESLKWTPFELSSRRKTGAWALTTDSNGNLWVGGDFTLSHTDATHTQWNGGFARYDNRDNVAPEAPTLLRSSAATASTVTLAWEGVSDAVSYEILRDDRPIASTTSATVEVPRGGNNRFFVRAVASDGLVGATTHAYTVDANGQPARPDDATILVEDDATWAYHWSNDAVAQDWAQTSYDDSSWSRGTAPIGYGAPDLGTTLKPGTPKTRPLTTYARTNFTVADPTAIGGINVSVTADDGAVVYVNGTEVVRQRMSEGTVTAGTYASAAATTASARADRQLVFVPADKLVAGTNTLAVETHLNYRSSLSMTIDGMVKVVAKGDEPAPEPQPDPEPAPQPQPDVPLTPDPDKPLEVLDVSAMNLGNFLYPGMYWNYWNSKEAPDPAWNSTADLSSWEHGASPLGWGDRDAGTPFTMPVADRAITNYFVRDVNFGTLSADFELTLDVRVDDGAVIYVNGTEIKRVNMPEGTIDANTRASSNVGLATAKNNIVRIAVPRKVLRDGVNRVAVETHANYANAASVTFDLKASLVR